MQFKTIKMIPLAAAVAFAFAGTASAEDLTVKIGHVAPTSGNQAHLGKDNEDGARMAIDELNAKNFMIGKQKAHFELLAEDDAADPKQGTAAAQKLVDAKVNGVIGHLNSGTTIPASAIYHTAGIPQISPSATSPAYTKQGFETAFRVCANDSQLGGNLGHYAVQTSGAKRIAVIDDGSAYGQGVATEFQKSASKGAKIVATEHTTDKATDFNAILTKIKAQKPDLVFFGGMDAVAGPMLKQMKTLGMGKTKFMGGDGICTEGLAKLAGDGMSDGQVVCAEAGGVEPAGQAALNAWKDSFKKKFGVDVQIYAPYVYDAVMTMATAMQKAGSSDPAKYLPVLAKIKYKGVTGDIEFDSKGDMKNGTITIYTYKGGERSIIKVTH